MSRYIDAVKLKEKVNERSSHWLNSWDTLGVLAIIDEMPAADVEEVRRGEWVQNSYCKRIYYCSECGRHIEDASFKPFYNFPYCHCGAKMDGKENDN